MKSRRYLKGQEQKEEKKREYKRQNQGIVTLLKKVIAEKIAKSIKAAA